MAFRGDMKRLGEVINVLTKAGRGDYVKAAAVKLGRKMTGLAEQGVSTAMAPSGRRWKPLKNGEGLPLRKLVGSFRAQTYDAAVKIVSSIGWAIFHQGGAKRITRRAGFARSSSGGKLSIKRVAAKVGWRLPARPVLPRRSLPKTWTSPVYDTLSEAWKELWKK